MHRILASILAAACLLRLCASDVTDARPPWDALLLVSFNRGDGSDRSWSNRTPTTSAGATFPAGYRVADFGGTSTAQISYPDAAELDTPPVTVCFWVRIDSGNAGRINLVGKHVDTATLSLSKGWYIHHATTTFGFIFACDQDGLTAYKVRYYGTSASYNDGTWRHLAWVMPDKNVPSGWTIYVNGSAVTTTDVSGAGNVTTMDTSEPLKIGGKNTNNQGQYFNGAIDDLRMFSTAKTAAEIGAIYAEGIGDARP